MTTSGSASGPLLAGNTGEILIMLVAALAGWPMPLLPLQILWINLATDGAALALATDPPWSRTCWSAHPGPPKSGWRTPPSCGLMLLTGPA